MGLNPDDCSGETQKQSVMERVAHFVSLGKAVGQSTQTRKHKSVTKGTTSETVLSKKTSLASLSAETERASSSGNYYLPRASQRKPNQDRRFDGKFDDKLRARIHEASTRENSKSSFKEMEVFKRPMLLVSTTDDDHLSLQGDVLDQIARIKLPLVVVSIVGLYRTGKSYLMNCLAGSPEEGFTVGRTVKPETTGIWVWCKVNPENPGTAILLLDTEGFGNVKKGDVRHANRILTLATLLCSCLIYNMKGLLDEFALYKLTFISEMSQNIYFSGIFKDKDARLTRTFDEGLDSMLSMIMPEFVLCLRDFNFDLKIEDRTLTEDEYLEDCLCNQENKDEKINTTKTCLKNFFPARKCLVFPFPSNLQHGIHDKDFLTAIDVLKKHVYSLEPKALMVGKPLNGRMFKHLATCYVEAMRKSELLNVSDVFRNVSKLENETIEVKVLQLFETTMKTDELPVPYKVLQQRYNVATQKALRYQRDNAFLDVEGEYENSAVAKMDERWREIQDLNASLIQEKCKQKLGEIFQRCIARNIQSRTYIETKGLTRLKNDVKKMKSEYFESFRNYEKFEIMKPWIEQKEEIDVIKNDIYKAFSQKEQEELRKTLKEEMNAMKEQYESMLSQAREAHEAEMKASKQKHQKERDDKLNEMGKQLEVLAKSKLHIEKELDQLNEQIRAWKDKNFIARVWDALTNTFPINNA